MKQTAAYIRCSSKQQNHTVQRKAIQQWADGQGIIVKFYSDKFTGRVMDRPGWTKLQQDMDSGKINHLVVHKLDRLGRNTRAVLGLFDYLNANKIRFTSLGEGFRLDTPSGKLMASILASFAQFDNEIRLGRINDGIAEAKEQGKTWGGSRKGWTKLSNEQIQAILNMNSEGMSKTAIAKLLSLSWPTVSKVIKQHVERWE